MVSVLCTCKGSVYQSLGCDCWPMERNAWRFNGPGRVIAHPPCRFWGNLSQFAKASDNEMQVELLLGIRCVRLVEKFGGVVEQPYGSRLFSICGVKPTMSVLQSWFGYSAPKKTWLFFSGVDLKKAPRMPLRLEIPLLDGPGSVNWISQSRREKTPLEFAQWLIAVVSG